MPARFKSAPGCVGVVEAELYECGELVGDGPGAGQVCWSVGQLGRLEGFRGELCLADALQFEGAALVREIIVGDQIAAAAPRVGLEVRGCDEPPRRGGATPALLSWIGDADLVRGCPAGRDGLE